MRKKVLLFLVLCISSFLRSQIIATYKPPIFRDGTRHALYAYIDRYLRYPKYEAQYGTEGGLSALIYISKEGKVRFVNTVGSKNVAFKKEIKRVMTLMPDWEPAQLNGYPVDTMVIQRFVFSQDVLKFENDSLTYEYGLSWQSYPESQIPDSLKQVWNKRELRKMKWKPLHNKATKEIMKGNFQIALGLLEESKKEGNYTSSLYYDMSVAYWNLGDTLKSCEYLREASLRGDDEAFNEYLKTCR